MKPLRLVPLIVLSSLTLASAGIASDHASMSAAPATEMQKAFDRLKSLSGTWVGPLSTTPNAPEVEGKFAELTLRTTSMGNALVHEMSVSGRADHPVTMFYLDDAHLMLTHYCDAGNRPRMTARLSPDGSRLEFDFLDLAGSNQYGHMHHAVFTFVDDTHHVEEWTWMAPGDKTTVVRLELQRTGPSLTASAH